MNKSDQNFDLLSGLWLMDVLNMTFASLNEAFTEGLV